jgi:NADH:ubiquinone oxidoreductase subunit 4 (subunit M)
MLLASLLLKLGGYGFLRFSLSMLHEGSAYFNSLVATLSLLGVVYGSLSTIRQIDLKRVIAYSSVAHMNLVMLGLFSYNQQGIEGATYLMVGHGVVSTALFFCVGVLYDRYHTRLLRYYGGLVTVMPLFSFFFFAFTLANMSFPGTSNFIGEILLFLGIFAQNSTTLLFSTAGIVLSAVYSVWLYNRVVFGALKTTYISRFSDISRRECAIFLNSCTSLLKQFYLAVADTKLYSFISLKRCNLSILNIVFNWCNYGNKVKRVCYCSITALAVNEIYATWWVFRLFSTFFHIYTFVINFRN